MQAASSSVEANTVPLTPPRSECAALVWTNDKNHMLGGLAGSGVASLYQWWQASRLTAGQTCAATKSATARIPAALGWNGAGRHGSGQPAPTAHGSADHG